MPKMLRKNLQRKRLRSVQSVKNKKQPNVQSVRNRKQKKKNGLSKMGLLHQRVGMYFQLKK